MWIQIGIVIWFLCYIMIIIWALKDRKRIDIVFAMFYPFTFLGWLAFWGWIGTFFIIIPK